MPLDKMFDVDDALDRALETFWEQGYEATSMRDLLERMGINRGSFYDTYKSKHDVLIDSLRRYDREYRRATLRRASEGRGPREAVTAVFRSMIENTCGQAGRRGCFLVNSALELAPKDPEVARIVRSGFRDVERFFTALIERGKADGEFPPQPGHTADRAGADVSTAGPDGADPLGCRWACTRVDRGPGRGNAGLIFLCTFGTNVPYSRLTG